MGTFPNQTDASGNPSIVKTGGSGGSPLSFMPGQKLSACTCSGSDHPGPSVSTGRGVPEIDIFETQIDTTRFQAEVSQSYQTAPYNYQYEFVNSSGTTPIYDESITHFNSYKGGVYQQAVSAVSDIDNANYGGNGYSTYGFEWWSDQSNRQDGYITWYSGGEKMWTMTADTIGADSTAEISARIVPEEPMVSFIPPSRIGSVC